MKCLCNFSFLFFLLACLVLSTPNAYATYGNLELEPCSEEELTQFADAIGLTFLGQEPTPTSIVSFDVSSDGYIVLGFDGEMVCIYSQEREFLYGYAFDAAGNFEVLWNNQNAGIYFYRSDVIATLDSNGKCILLQKVTNSASNELYIRNILNGTTKTVDGIEYKLERDIPLGESYGRLCAVDPDGNIIILYDATEAHNMSKILSICCVALFTGIVIIFFVRKVKKGETLWNN